MNPALASVIGAGFGTGALLIVSGLRSRPVSLHDLANSLSRPGTPATDTTPADGAVATDFRLRAGRAGLGALARAGFDVDTLRVRLRILDKPIEQHIYEKLFAGVAGFGLPVLMMLLLAAGGVTVSPLVVLVAALVMATAGFFYPDLPLGDKVEDRRRSFLHSLSSFLDLVTIIMAGGGGIESALHGAADAGDGWAFEELRDALRRARLTGQTPWATLADLGSDLGISQLVELAAAVSLAGGHGARIKESLNAKADGLRVALAADLEAAAETQTEKMIVPVMVMILGLVFFIGYGAVEAISTPTTTTPAPAVDAP